MATLTRPKHDKVVVNPTTTRGKVNVTPDQFTYSDPEVVSRLLPELNKVSYDQEECSNSVAHEILDVVEEMIVATETFVDQQQNNSIDHATEAFEDRQENSTDQNSLREAAAFQALQPRQDSLTSTNLYPEISDDENTLSLQLPSAPPDLYMQDSVPLVTSSNATTAQNPAVSQLERNTTSTPNTKMQNTFISIVKKLDCVMVGLPEVWKNTPSHTIGSNQLFDHLQECVNCTSKLQLACKQLLSATSDLSKHTEGVWEDRIQTQLPVTVELPSHEFPQELQLTLNHRVASIQQAKYDELQDVLHKYSSTDYRQIASEYHFVCLSQAKVEFFLSQFVHKWRTLNEQNPRRSFEPAPSTPFVEEATDMLITLFHFEQLLRYNNVGDLHKFSTQITPNVLSTVAATEMKYWGESLYSKLQRWIKFVAGECIRSNEVALRYALMLLVSRHSGLSKDASWELELVQALPYDPNSNVFTATSPAAIDGSALEILIDMINILTAVHRRESQVTTVGEVTAGSLVGETIAGISQKLSSGFSKLRTGFSSLNQNNEEETSPFILNETELLALLNQCPFRTVIHSSFKASLCFDRLLQLALRLVSVVGHCMTILCSLRSVIQTLATILQCVAESCCNLVEEKVSGTKECNEAQMLCDTIIFQITKVLVHHSRNSAGQFVLGVLPFQYLSPVGAWKVLVLLLSANQDESLELMELSQTSWNAHIEHHPQFRDEYFRSLTDPPSPLNSNVAATGSSQSTAMSALGAVFRLTAIARVSRCQCNHCETQNVLHCDKYNVQAVALQELVHIVLHENDSNSTQEESVLRAARDSVVAMCNSQPHWMKVTFNLVSNYSGIVGSAAVPMFRAFEVKPHVVQGSNLEWLLAWLAADGEQLNLKVVGLEVFQNLVDYLFVEDEGNQHQALCFSLIHVLAVSHQRIVRDQNSSKVGGIGNMLRWSDSIPKQRSRAGHSTNEGFVTSPQLEVWFWDQLYKLAWMLKGCPQGESKQVDDLRNRWDDCFTLSGFLDAEVITLANDILKTSTSFKDTISRFSDIEIKFDSIDPVLAFVAAFLPGIHPSSLQKYNKSNDSEQVQTASAGITVESSSVESVSNRNESAAIGSIESESNHESQTVRSDCTGMGNENVVKVVKSVNEDELEADTDKQHYNADDEQCMGNENVVKVVKSVNEDELEADIDKQHCNADDEQRNDGAGNHVDPFHFWIIVNLLLKCDKKREACLVLSSMAWLSGKQFPALLRYQMPTAWLPAALSSRQSSSVPRECIEYIESCSDTNNTRTSTNVVDHVKGAILQTQRKENDTQQKASFHSLTLAIRHYGVTQTQLQAWLSVVLQIPVWYAQDQYRQFVDEVSLLVALGSRDQSFMDVVCKMLDGESLGDSFMQLPRNPQIALEFVTSISIARQNWKLWLSFERDFEALQQAQLLGTTQSPTSSLDQLEELIRLVLRRNDVESLKLVDHEPIEMVTIYERYQVIHWARWATTLHHSHPMIVPIWQFLINALLPSTNNSTTPSPKSFGMALLDVVSRVASNQVPNTKTLVQCAVKLSKAFFEKAAIEEDSSNNSNAYSNNLAQGELFQTFAIWLRDSRSSNSHVKPKEFQVDFLRMLHDSRSGLLGPSTQSDMSPEVIWWEYSRRVIFEIQKQINSSFPNQQRRRASSATHFQSPHQTLSKKHSFEDHEPPYPMMKDPHQYDPVFVDVLEHGALQCDSTVKQKTLTVDEVNVLLEKLFNATQQTEKAWEHVVRRIQKVSQEILDSIGVLYVAHTKTFNVAHKHHGESVNVSGEYVEHEIDKMAHESLAAHAESLKHLFVECSVNGRSDTPWYHTDLCVWKITVEAVLERGWLCEPSQLLEILERLITLETQQSRACPATKHVVWALISNTCNACAEVFQSQQNNPLPVMILKWMIQDPERYELLQNQFHPESCPSETFSMLKQIWKCRNLFDEVSLASLFNRLALTQWVQSPNTSDSECKQLICLLCDMGFEVGSVPTNEEVNEESPLLNVVVSMFAQVSPLLSVTHFDMMVGLLFKDPQCTWKLSTASASLPFEYASQRVWEIVLQSTMHSSPNFALITRACETATEHLKHLMQWAEKSDWCHVPIGIIDKIHALVKQLIKSFVDSLSLQSIMVDRTKQSQRSDPHELMLSCLNDTLLPLVAAWCRLSEDSNHETLGLSIQLEGVRTVFSSLDDLFSQQRPTGDMIQIRKAAAYEWLFVDVFVNTVYDIFLTTGTNCQVLEEFKTMLLRFTYPEFVPTNRFLDAFHNILRRQFQAIESLNVEVVARREPLPIVVVFTTLCITTEWDSVQQQWYSLLPKLCSRLHSTLLHAVIYAIALDPSTPSTRSMEFMKIINESVSWHGVTVQEFEQITSNLGANLLCRHFAQGRWKSPQVSLGLSNFLFHATCLPSVASWACLDESKLAYASDSFQRVCSWLKLIRSLLVVPAFGEQSDLLPFAPATLVMLVFQALKYLGSMSSKHHAQSDTFSVAQPQSGEFQDQQEQLGLGAHNFNQPMKEILAFLNVNGVKFEPRSWYSTLGQDRKQISTTDAMLDSVENAIQAVTSFIPKSLLGAFSAPSEMFASSPPTSMGTIDGNASKSDQAPSITSTLQGAPKHDHRTKIGNTSKSIESEESQSSKWLKWSTMWRYIGPRMVAQIKLDMAEGASKTDGTTVPPKVAVAGTGIAVLIWEFIDSGSPLHLPLVVQCALATVTDVVVVARLLERCTLSWLSHSTTWRPFMRILGGPLHINVGWIELQQASMDHAQLVSVYLFTLHRLRISEITPVKGLSQVVGVLVNLGNAVTVAKPKSDQAIPIREEWCGVMVLLQLFCHLVSYSTPGYSASFKFQYVLQVRNALLQIWSKLSRLNLAHERATEFIRGRDDSVELSHEISDTGKGSEQHPSFESNNENPHAFAALACACWLESCVDQERMLLIVNDAGDTQHLRGQLNTKGVQLWKHFYHRIPGPSSVEQLGDSGSGLVAPETTTWAIPVLEGHGGNGLASYASFFWALCTEVYPALPWLGQLHTNTAAIIGGGNHVQHPRNDYSFDDSADVDSHDQEIESATFL